MRMLITGGAGFIGANLATALARGGDDVVIADNLSRPGSANNLRAILDEPALAPRITFHQLDVRDFANCLSLLAENAIDAVAHLAGQVAVTDSLTDPIEDFDVNARGTLNVLEAVRRHQPEAHVLFTSTNKVYGSLNDLRAERTTSRYVLVDYPDGIPETRPTDPATPYGCSKLSAEAYVRDYGSTYALRTTVFRMSCIYGKRQNGTASQGWVSWFVRAALTGSPVTIYGDGMQVRDVLYVDDLVAAMLVVLHTGAGTGETFNVGGGSKFSLSVWGEFRELLEGLVGRQIPVCFAECRPGDQNVYVSDIRRVSTRLSWTPLTPPALGIAEVAAWTRAQLSLGNSSPISREAML
jgi:CDP-paratose 2-epimerase